LGAVSRRWLLRDYTHAWLHVTARGYRWRGVLAAAPVDYDPASSRALRSGAEPDAHPWRRVPQNGKPIVAGSCECRLAERDNAQVSPQGINFAA
jgi:hypothetical protein